MKSTPCILIKGRQREIWTYVHRGEGDMHLQKNVYSAVLGGMFYRYPLGLVSFRSMQAFHPC